MQIGTIISGGAHTALILFAFFGGMFARDELPPPDVAQVTVLSEEEFAALTRPDVGEQAEVSEPPTAALEIPNAVEPEAELAPEPAPPPDPAPEVVPEPEPTPEPEPAPEPEPLPEPEPDLPPASQEPEIADDRPVAPDDVPRPRQRVSVEATPAPPPDAEEAPEIVEAPEPEPVEEPEQVVEDRTPTAPPETAEEIVTEAETPSQLTNAAPTGTPRPRTRPARPTPPAVAEAPRTEGNTQSAASDNVNEAAQETIAGLEQLLNQAPQEGIPAGPPLTAGEKEAFRLAVRRCWNVDTGSQAANVTVSIRFQMTQDAKVVSSSIRQTGADGGSPAAINAAFEAGRRAILRCQNEDGGYNLPVEKYGQWQTVEVTFNPEGMRLR